MTDRVRVGGQVHELTAARALQLVRRPLPVAGPGEVVLRPLAVGICGTDVHIWRGRVDRLPTVLTHDGVAEVTAVGPGVDASLVGRRVVPDPVDHCGICPSCANGHPGACTSGGYLGLTVDGLLADVVVMPAKRVVTLPDAVDDAAATVLEPVAMGLRVVREAMRHDVEPGPVLVVGAGPLGILASQVLVSAGWSPRLIEPQPERRALARRLGLDAASPDEADLRGPYFLVVDTSASEAGTRAALAAIHDGGLLVLVGRSPAAISAAYVLLHELTVQGVKGASGMYEEAVRLVAVGAAHPGAVISHYFARDELIDALNAHDATPPPMRAVVRM
jgi:threonine dehydrogenase-like Zn-dependent dehydrogenase